MSIELLINTMPHKHHTKSSAAAELSNILPYFCGGRPLRIVEFAVLLSNLHREGRLKSGSGLVSSLESMLKAFHHRSIFFMSCRTDSSSAEARTASKPQFPKLKFHHILQVCFFN